MERSKWVDVYKGVAIILVVAGHIFDGPVRDLIFLFHMPLFFFISGYLYKPKSYFNYFTKKSQSLLTPYFSFLLVFSVLYLLIDGDVNIYALIYGGRELKGIYGVFWFVTCLFITQQFYNYFYKNFNPKSLFIIMFFSLCFSYLNSLILSEYYLPWNLNVVFASLPLFYAGNIYKTRGLDSNYISLLGLSLLVIIFTLLFPENIYDMKYSIYGIPFITFFSSLILCLFVLMTSKILSRYKFLNSILSKIGLESSSIMYLHILFYLATDKYISENSLLCFLLSLSLSYLAAKIISRFRVLKIYFKGFKSSK
ncbi:MAG: hypothetical protein CMP75_04220 [Flavobacteriales bacterium]|nr:hypothetical protein [Flavobacteriales bacterium]|tara:strand:- start:399 stop:1328 length:930 start_codon:yes stop_codon:yes gene_type:complete